MSEILPSHPAIINHVGPARVVLGPAVHRKPRDFGIFDVQGNAAPFCHDATGTRRTEELLGPYEELRADLIADAGHSVEGPVLYAGLADRQFGFAILQSLGRLWACERLPPETQLMFLSNIRPRTVLPPLTALLNWLGIPNQPFLLQGNLQLEQGYTCPSLFGDCHDGQAYPEFRDWLVRRLGPVPPLEAGRKIYVSRSGLGALYGRNLCEGHLEDLLRRDGFEIFRPEAHDLPTQADTYRRAETLVFSEGSALHFFGLVKRAGQRVVVIQRRHEVPVLIRNQLEAIDPTPVDYIDAIESLCFPPVRADNRALSILDFKRLRRGLIRAGALRRKAFWQAPTEEEVEASAHAGLEPGTQLFTTHEEAIAAWKKARMART